MTDFSITLNVQQGCSHQRCVLRRGDQGGLLRLTLRDAHRSPDFSAASAALTARKPGGSLVYQDCTLEAWEVQIPITRQLTDQAGEVACEVRLFDGRGNLLTTGRFYLEVSDTLYHDGDDIEPPQAPTRVLMAPAHCREGQYFRVSQVDENGTAVKVEATDSPGGGYYTPLFSVEETGIAVTFSKSEPWMEDAEGAHIPMPQGIPGPEGPQGETGPQGEQGIPGPQGLKGEVGPEGPQGETGPQGEQGIPGPRGPQGEIGPQGPQGQTGPAGPRGEKGEKGDPGADGTMTFADLTQEQKDSLKGAPGETGPRGEQGPQGDPGPRGEAGPKGDTGPQGEQGPQGEKGDKGDSYTLTQADTQTIVQAVLAALPSAEEVYY